MEEKSGWVEFWWLWESQAGSSGAEWEDSSGYSLSRAEQGGCCCVYAIHVYKSSTGSVFLLLVTAVNKRRLLCCFKKNFQLLWQSFPVAVDVMEAVRKSFEGGNGKRLKTNSSGALQILV